jgi:hypothetical protein
VIEFTTGGGRDGAGKQRTFVDGGAVARGDGPISSAAGLHRLSLPGRAGLALREGKAPVLVSLVRPLFQWANNTFSTPDILYSIAALLEPLLARSGPAVSLLIHHRIVVPTQPKWIRSEKCVFHSGHPSA